LPDDAAHVNPNGGAIAIGHPLGASGARPGDHRPQPAGRTGGRYALCTMCIGVGQGIALVIERIAASATARARMFAGLQHAAHGSSTSRS
jgi:acetyl-CoA acetyltransferase